MSAISTPRGRGTRLIYELGAVRACDARGPADIISCAFPLHGGSVSDRPRLLLIGPPPGSLDGALPAADVESVSIDPVEVARRLVDGNFSAVLTTPEVVAGLLDRYRRDELILSHIDKGLAVLDPAGTVTWANPVFRAYSPTDPVGRSFMGALGARVTAVETPNDPTRPAEQTWGAPTGSRLVDPLAPALRGVPTVLRMQCPTNPNQPYLEADIRPVLGPSSNVAWLIALIRNVTPEV